MSDAWTMPEWMEPYRRFFFEPGRVEEWMGRERISPVVNAPGAIHQTISVAEVRLLERLHEAKLIGTFGEINDRCAFLVGEGALTAKQVRQWASEMGEEHVTADVVADDVPLMVSVLPKEIA